MRVADLDQALLGGSSLQEIQLTAERRLRQIEPLIQEAERLRQVLKLIEHRPGDTPSQPASGKKAAREAAPRAAKGANKRAILELVGRMPGITASEISHTTGMKRTVVASTLSRLKRQGELRDHERGGVRLAGVSSLEADAGKRRSTDLSSSAGRRRRVASLA